MNEVPEEQHSETNEPEIVAEAAPESPASQSSNEPEEPKPSMSIDELVPTIQALLFAGSEPLSERNLAEVLQVELDAIKSAVERVKELFSGESCAFEIAEVAGKIQLRTKERFGSYIRLLKADKPKRLSAPALETLAIIAYRQPVVKSDIEKIRGVDTSPTLKTLLERDLIKIVGHQQTVGQPALYGTTDEFLKIFGLKNLGELPTLRDLAALEREPGEVEEVVEEENAPSAPSGEITEAAA